MPSLGNPRLGFVCVSEDMTGEFGLCGYFKEYDHDLTPEERLVFAKHERPPAYDATQQPEPPADQWPAARLAKANRNYALDYIRNGLIALSAVVGAEEAQALGVKAARLIGLQYYSETAAALDISDQGIASGAAYLQRLFGVLGDEIEVQQTASGFTLTHTNLRVNHGLSKVESDLVGHCWQALWQGAMQSRREMLMLHASTSANGIRWTLELA